MNVLIAEDENLAAERLQELLLACEPSASVVDRLDSVDDLVNFFRSGKQIDLLLLDIQLADGKSFELFGKVNVEAPIIFITAFDQYALQAFKYLSVDYLLKPVQAEDLSNALGKLKKFSNDSQGRSNESVLQALAGFKSHKVKERVLIKSGNKLVFKNMDEAAYFFADGKSVFLVSQKENRKFLIDYTLEELENILDRKLFFRVSRKFIVNIHCIQEIKGLLGSRFELKINTPCDHNIHVSRDRAHDFKIWLDQ